MLRPSYALALTLFLAAASCGSKPAPCSVETCVGCCDAEGTCQEGASAQACGVHGAQCSVCTATQICFHGCASTTGGTGGGDAASGGGFAATGGSSSTGGAGALGGGNEGVGGAGAGTSGAGSPVITSLTASGALEDYGFVTVTAVVTDPDGLGDLSGGVLLLGAGGPNIGAFSGAVGQYTFTLTWSALPTSALNFGPAGTTLQLQAVFYDHSSKQGTSILSLQVNCYDTAANACSGTCDDLSTSLVNCGQCGRAVPAQGTCANGVPTCPQGTTLCADGCVDLNTSITDCNACGHDCNAWAASKGLPADSYLTCSAGMSCQTDVEASARATCDSVCAGKGLTCLNRLSCSIDYSPYYTQSIYGGCVSYATASSGCLDDYTVACNALPPASLSSCDNYTAAWNYSYQSCLCH